MTIYKLKNKKLVPITDRREELIELQKQYCDQRLIPYFAENSINPGYCLYCFKDIVTERWATELITGCNHCMRSYCD